MVWTAEYAAAVVELVGRYGPKWAAAMCGVTPTGLRNALRLRAGVTLRGIPRA